MPTSWFDPDTGLLQLDEHVAVRPTFQRILADGVVTDDEVQAQAELTTALLRRLDAELTGDLHALATDALCELAVLYAIDRLRAV